MSRRRLAASVPVLDDLLAECLDRKQAIFWPLHEGLHFGCVWGSGKFVAVEPAQHRGGEEHPDFAELRAAGAHTMTISRAGGCVFVRGRLSEDMLVEEGETILDAYFRMTGPGPRAARVVIPIGSGIPVAVTDGQVSIGADADGVHTATTIAIPKVAEMKQIGAALLRRMVKG